jgi:hypothetical protein
MDALDWIRVLVWPVTILVVAVAFVWVARR